MIGLIAAMQMEVDAILREMDDVRKIRKGPVDFYTGSIEGHPVVLGLAGVGKTAAAMAATLMLSSFDVEALINVGVAGGLKEDQRVGDLVISDTIVQADFDTSVIDGPEGLGLIYQADASLIEKADQAAKELSIPHRVGMIASQDLFMARPEDFEKLKSRFETAACSEMEGGAVAAVAHAFDIPCLVLRSLSDVVVHEDNPMEFGTFAQLASARAALLLKGMLKQMQN